MKKISHFDSSFQSFSFSVNVYSKNNGLIIDLIGPQEHLGGVGVGIPYMKDDGYTTANSHTIAIPRHRDAELAGKLARIVAKYTEKFTIVILGIHIPNLSKDMLKDLTEFLENWFMEIGLEITKVSFSD